MGWRRWVAAAGAAVLAASACTDKAAIPEPTPLPPAPTAACLPATGPVASAPMHAPLTDIVALNRESVWAVGSQRIVHTADGGSTWQRQYAGPADLTSVEFVDRLHGWAVSRTALLATEDGGGCWTERPAPPTVLKEVDFVDARQGWGVGIDSGALVRTADAGRSWQRLPAPPRVKSVCFVDAYHGWLAADALWSTSDGGGTWEPTGFPDAPAALAYLDCAPGAAWVVASYGGAMGCTRHELYRVPSGEAAVPVLANPCHRPPADVPPTPGLSASGLSVLDTGTAVLAGYTSALPAGRTTTVAVVADGQVRHPGTPVPTVTASHGVAFTSAELGWVIGVPSSAGGTGPTQGVIARTTDGGKWWDIQYWTG
ncbi:MAG: WD40/YVTN/BNR-like repeat-containing protein [Acidimicrobiia bacterium]